MNDTELARKIRQEIAEAFEDLAAYVRVYSEENEITPSDLERIARDLRTTELTRACAAAERAQRKGERRG